MHPGPTDPAGTGRRRRPVSWPAFRRRALRQAGGLFQTVGAAEGFVDVDPLRGEIRLPGLCQNGANSRQVPVILLVEGGPQPLLPGGCCRRDCRHARRRRRRPRAHRVGQHRGSNRAPGDPARGKRPHLRWRRAACDDAQHLLIRRPAPCERTRENRLSRRCDSVSTGGQAGDPGRPLQAVARRKASSTSVAPSPLLALGQPGANAFQMLDVLDLEGGQQLLVDIHQS